jgi:hypothetical protein
MAAMRDHDLVTIPIGLEGGTDLLPYGLTHGLLHGSDVTGIGSPCHGLHNGLRGLPSSQSRRVKARAA